MAQFETEAYCWSDHGYNAIYTTSVTATFDDGDGAFQGAGDANETISIDGAEFSASDSEPYVIKIAFTTPEGDSFEENFQFFQTDGNWYFAPGVDSEFVEGSTLGSYQSHTVGWNYNDIVCFAAGTLISTTRGPVLVEHLRPGDGIITSAGEARPLRWSMVRRFGPVDLFCNPKLRPIRIRSGSLGRGLPKQDLLISRQHRILVRSPIVQRMMKEPAALIAAHQLTQLDGVSTDHSISQIDYHHLLFDKHEIILAEGIPAESLYLGPETLRTLPPEALDEIKTILGTIRAFLAAPCPKTSKQHSMVKRHKMNNRALVK